MFKSNTQNINITVIKSTPTLQQAVLVFEMYLLISKWQKYKTQIANDTYKALYRKNICAVMYIDPLKKF
jgi:hypothetical protein